MTATATSAAPRRDARVVYFIASHREPKQILRLVGRIRLERPDNLILIHHDYSKSNFPRELLADDQNIEFVEQWVSGEWGGFSLVQLALNGLDQLFERGHAFDWVAFMSGQDYPSRSLLEFEENLQSIGDGAIVYSDNRSLNLDRYRFGYYRLPRKFETRFAHRVFFVFHLISRFQPFVRFTTGRIGCRIGFRMHKRIFASGLEIQKGFQWWTLSRKTLAYVRAFVRTRPDVVSWFRTRVLVPDEAFFQTILSNAGLCFVNDDGHYAKWSHSESLNPEILCCADLPAIVESGKYFARKFDIGVDAGVLDLLDERTIGTATERLRRANAADSGA